MSVHGCYDIGTCVKLVKSFCNFHPLKAKVKASETLRHYGAVVVVVFYYYLGSLWTVKGTNRVGL